MTRLIDADVLLKQSRRIVEYDEAGFSMEYNAVPTEEIKNAPTVDDVPVVRGEWKCIDEENEAWECSVCGKVWCLYGTPIDNGMNYCPNCGARMVKDNE